MLTTMMTTPRHHQPDTATTSSTATTPPSTSTISSTASSLFSPIHQRLLEWEERWRRWKLFSRRPRRSTSQDPKSNSSHSTHNTPRRPVDFGKSKGPLTCPVPRRAMYNIQGGHNPDRQGIMEREILSNSGRIQIGTQIYTGIRIDQLEILNDLGSGTCGNVTKRQLDNRVLAVKEMKLTDNDQERRRIFTDLQVIKNSNDCRYIVKSLGYILTYDYVYICMEVMTMCLEKLYKEHLKPQNITFPEQVLGHVTINVVKALKYLKDTHRMIHRDVKPSNILIDWAGNIKLCDFGIAGKLIDSIASTTSMGCMAYLSPERLQSNTTYGAKADIWSLGMTLIELAALDYPLKFESPFHLMVMITEHEPPTLPESYSPLMKKFVESCMQKNPDMRASYDDIMEHEWFKKYNNTSSQTVIGDWMTNVVGQEED